MNVGVDLVLTVDDVGAKGAVSLFADQPVVAVGRLDDGVADLGERFVVVFAAELHGFALACAAAHEKRTGQDGGEKKFRLVHFLVSQSLVEQASRNEGVSPRFVAGLSYRTPTSSTSKMSVA